MALLHDLTETRTGDLPSTIKSYFDKASIKAADEAIAKDIFAELGDLSDSYLELWFDYEHRASVESKLVKAADKLDLLVQSREYEKGGARSLQEFWDTADSDFAGLGVDDLISDLIEELKEQEKGLGGVSGGVWILWNRQFRGFRLCRLSAYWR